MLDTIHINVVNLMGMKPGHRAIYPLNWFQKQFLHTHGCLKADSKVRQSSCCVCFGGVCLSGRSLQQSPAPSGGLWVSNNTLQCFLCSSAFWRQHGGTSLLFGDSCWFWRVTLSIRAYVYAIIAGLFHCSYRNKQHPQTDRLHTFVSAWIPQWQRCDIPVAPSQTDSHISLSPHSQHLSLFVHLVLYIAPPPHPLSLTHGCNHVFARTALVGHAQYK